MKNSILLIALGLILLTGCSKDDSIELIEEQTTNSVYVLYQLNEIASWETIVLDEFQRTVYIQHPITAHTDGYYRPTSRDGMSLTWSGTQHRDGYRKGSAEFKQSTPNFILHFSMETECVTVEGNEAVYGGIITQVKATNGNSPNISAGWRFYFKVIDSGQGSTVTYDQIANITMFASPMSPSLCGFLPNYHIWSSQGYSDVIDPGYVVVSIKE